MDKVYLYNGSFSSLISLIMELLRLNIIPFDIKNENEYIPSLITESIELKIENYPNNSKDILPIINTIYYVYLSSDNNKELIIYYFIKNYLKYKNGIFNHHYLKCVNKTLKLSKKVSREAHKLKGFLRFKYMKNNFYYAEIEPDNNVISILVKHFKQRMKEQNWVIKDTKRNLYAFYELGKVNYLTNDEIIKLNLEVSNNEYDIEELWKSFFKTIAIKERKNLKCQMNFVPKKYWKNMLEMENIDEKSN